jgi:hypothetical protein
MVGVAGPGGIRSGPTPKDIWAEVDYFGVRLGTDLLVRNVDGSKVDPAKAALMTF